MFGKRRKPTATEESTVQSDLILDSLESIDEEDSYDEEMSQEESLIADIFSGDESGDKTDSYDQETDYEEQSEEEEEVIQDSKPKRKGFFSFFRRPKKDIRLYEEEDSEEEAEEEAPETDEDYIADEEPAGDMTSADESGVETGQAEETAAEESSEFNDFDWMQDDEDLVLNPALFALADEIEDPDEGEASADDKTTFSLFDEVSDTEDTSAELFDDSVDGDDAGTEDFDAAADDFETEYAEAADDAEGEDTEGTDEEGEEAEDYEEDDEFEDNLLLRDEGSTRKKILIGAGIAALVLGLAAFFILRNMQKGPEGKAYVQKVEKLMGYNLSSTHTNRYSGIVEAQKQTKITLEQDMTVERCYVKVGDDVKKGDRLFKYDTDALKLQAQKKQLEIDKTNQRINKATQSKAEYDKDARTKKDRQEVLEAQQGSLEQEYNIEGYKLDLQALKKELDAINKNIKNSVVKSKTNGQVLKINKKLGQGSAEDEESESNASEGTDNAYIIIVAKGDYQVRAKINETSMQAGDRIKRGDPVIIRSRISNQTWDGVIKSMRTDQKAEEEQSTEEDIYGDSSGSETDTKYPCVIELSSSKGLMLGQHVLVELASGSGSIAPDEAGKNDIELDPSFVLEEGGKYYVFADNGHKRIEKRQIKVGEFDEVTYIVKSGLKKSDYIAATLNVKVGMATTTNENDEEIVNNGSPDEEGDEGEDGLGDEEELEDEEDLEGFQVDGLEQ